MNFVSEPTWSTCVGCRSLQRASWRVGDLVLVGEGGKTQVVSRCPSRYKCVEKLRSRLQESRPLLEKNSIRPGPRHHPSRVGLGCRLPFFRVQRDPGLQQKAPEHHLAVDYGIQNVGEA